MHSAAESSSHSFISSSNLLSPISKSTTASIRSPGMSGLFTSTEQNQHLENTKTKGRSQAAGTLNGYLVSIKKKKKKNPSLSIIQAPQQITNFFFLKNIQQGPRDPTRHSKVPCFMRVHGSIFPKMIIPVLIVGIWATAVTLISKHVYSCMTFFFFFFFFSFPISQFLI